MRIRTAPFPLLPALALVLTATVVAPTAATAQATDPTDASAWQVVELGRGGDLTVRLRVRRTASIADADWLAFEFENRGVESIVLQNPSYSTSTLANPPSTPTWQLTLPLPNVPLLVGLEVAFQAIYAGTTTPLGMDLTNGVWARLGY